MKADERFWITMAFVSVAAVIGVSAAAVVRITLVYLLNVWLPVMVGSTPGYLLRVDPWVFGLITTGQIYLSIIFTAAIVVAKFPVPYDLSRRPT